MRQVEAGSGGGSVGLQIEERSARLTGTEDRARDHEEGADVVDLERPEAADVDGVAASTDEESEARADDVLGGQREPGWRRWLRLTWMEPEKKPTMQNIA